MITSCFEKKDEMQVKFEPEDLDKMVDFLAGKAGKTFLVYYQKPYVKNDKSDNTVSPYLYFNDEAKKKELLNRACFFVRNIADGKPVTLTTVNEDVSFGEITPDSVIGMNKVIYNYLFKTLDGYDDWGKGTEEQQKKDFKKVLEAFANEINDTVDSLINGVTFQPLSKETMDFIGLDKKDMIAEDSKEYGAKIEEIYADWINVLSEEVEKVEKGERMDKAEEGDENKDIGPKNELFKWKYRMQRLIKVNDFFRSKDFKAVTKYFDDQKSKLSLKVVGLKNDMKIKRVEAHTALAEARDNVKYLCTLEIYFDPLYNGTPDNIIDSLQSLMNSLKLISFTARYYDSTKMTNLFSQISSQMIKNCKEYLLDSHENPNHQDPEYLWEWEKKPDELIEKFKKCIELYEKYKEKYKEAKQNTNSTNRENTFEFGENQLFGKFEQFKKRLIKLKDLFTTIKQFNEIRAHKLDSMEDIQERYDEELKNFKEKATFLLRYEDTTFDKNYVRFNLQISDIETNLHKNINDEFKKINWIEKKLKLLEKYEKILTKENLQENLKTEKLEIFSNYKRDIEFIQNQFDNSKVNPSLQRNMPTISGRIKWAKQLFNRIFPFINRFKDIAAKDRKETEVAYMTTNTLLYSYIILNESFFTKFVDTAKTKLTMPLLIINDNSSPKVNLDLYVLQLIREAKCMLRMNCEIPESAKIILLQEEKYKKYYNELTFMCKEYNRILSRIHQSTAEGYYKAHIKDLNSKLTPLKTTINWSSMNIDSSLQVVFECLQRFEYSIDSFMEILDNRVHRNMLNIRKLNLLSIPENPTSLSINEIIQNQEEHIKTQNEFLQSKNKEIESAILDMIEGIKAYELDPKIQKVDESTLYKLITDYEDKFYEFLIATTKNSLLNLKDRINGENSEPIFSVSVDLVGGNMEISPKISLIQEAINKIGKSILYAMKGINTWKKYESNLVQSFHERIGKNNEIIKMILVLTGSFQANSDQIDTYLRDTFTEFKPIYKDSIDKSIKEFDQRKNKTYTDYEEKLNHYTEIQNKIDSISDKVNKGAVELDLTKIKEFLSKSCKDWKNAYIRQLLLITRAKSRQIGGELTRYEEMLDKQVDGIADLQEVVTAIEEIREKEGTIEDEIKPYCMYSALVRQQFNESDMEKFRFASTATKDEFDEKWKRILVKAGNSRDEFKSKQLEFKKKLYEDASTLKEQVRVLKEDYDKDGPTQQKGRVEDAIFKLQAFRGRVSALNRQWEVIKKGEIIFSTSKNLYPELEQIDGELSVLGTLYDLYSAVRATREDWKEILFSEIIPKKVEKTPEEEAAAGGKEEFVSEKLEEMDQKKQEYASQKFRVDAKLRQSDEYHNLEAEIDELAKFVDSLMLITDPYFEDYHFKHLSEVLDVPELANVKVDGGNFKIKLLLDKNIGARQEDIEDEKNLAKVQKKVRDNLAKIEEIWKTRNFKFIPHKTITPELQLLEAIEAQEIKNILEEHQGSISSFKAMSRNLTDELKVRIRQKEVAFQTMSSTIDLWLAVQQLWNSLQSFFLGGDIKKDLPGPTAAFGKVHDLWRKIMMDKAFPTKNVYSLCANGELNPDLTEIESVLKLCQQKLDTYLEQKRGHFPRFYFVSNSVLLDILSKRSDPANIKTNLGIIFDALNDIEFNKQDKKTIIKIRQLKNAANPDDKQEVDISNHPVKAEGKIEEWLCDLVDSMKLSLKDLFEIAYKDVKVFFDMKLNADNREQFKAFINKYICQVVIFGIQLFGTKRLEELIVYCTADKNGEANKKKLVAAALANTTTGEHQSRTDFREILTILTAMCREGNSKSKLALVKLEALIIIHVHNIDIYDYFIKDKDMQRQKVTINDYEWLKQTRVYWYVYKSATKDVRTMLINITDVAFEYGYEFLGARERMCITPLTDKCYITLAQAMGMTYGGAPAGPAGTGKTETVKDMGRTMGVFVLVTNCAPEHRYKNMAEIFKGLCQSGAWGCFDEFNRIQLDVLSVLATIVAAIQDCRKKGNEEFEFPEGAGNYKKIELVPTMGYFITMNPGYSGRQELPENLKVLFRGVTMMAPNRESIIRVKLCSYGFEKAQDIAAKFRKLYELCEAQLSKQTHYDFGLRNILSVLRHGGNEKKKHKDDLKIEEELIYTALRNMNLSKFVPDDKPLFESLIRDVFPQQKNTKEKEYPELDKHIVKILDEQKLDKRPEWKKKIIQTYETYNVRHGFMIV
ncbi:MAG: hypothetical protein MJ252_04065, partial [archaeon]|nr:hypothetical protein [archaeon]